MHARTVFDDSVRALTKPINMIRPNKKFETMVSEVPCRPANWIAAAQTTGPLVLPGQYFGEKRRSYSNIQQCSTCGWNLTAGWELSYLDVWSSSVIDWAEETIPQKPHSYMIVIKVMYLFNGICVRSLLRATFKTVRLWKNCWSTVE